MIRETRAKKTKTQEVSVHWPVRLLRHAKRLQRVAQRSPWAAKLCPKGGHGCPRGAPMGTPTGLEHLFDSGSNWPVGPLMQVDAHHLRPTALKIAYPLSFTLAGWSLVV